MTDSNLSFRTHINQLVNKAEKKGSNTRKNSPQLRWTKLKQNCINKQCSRILKNIINNSKENIEAMPRTACGFQTISPVAHHSGNYRTNLNLPLDRRGEIWMKLATDF